MSKEQEISEKYKALHIGGFSVSLPSVDDAGIIAAEIADINNEMTAQEQAFFIAGFSECIKYLFEKHRNETGKLSMDEPTAQKLLKSL